MVKSILAGLVAAAALALVAVPVALADDPNGTQYGNPSGGVSTEPPPTTTSEPPPTTTSEPPPTTTTDPPAITTEPPAITTSAIVPATRTNVKGQTASATVKAKPSVAPKGGSLPFTGLDLGLVLGFGIVLVGGGLLLRRTGRTNER